MKAKVNFHSILILIFIILLIILDVKILQSCPLYLCYPECHCVLYPACPRGDCGWTGCDCWTSIPCRCLVDLCQMKNCKTDGCKAGNCDEIICPNWCSNGGHQPCNGESVCGLSGKCATIPQKCPGYGDSQCNTCTNYTGIMCQTNLCSAGCCGATNAGVCYFCSHSQKPGNCEKIICATTPNWGCNTGSSCNQNGKCRTFCRNEKQKDCQGAVQCSAHAGVCAGSYCNLSTHQYCGTICHSDHTCSKSNGKDYGEGNCRRLGCDCCNRACPNDTSSTCVGCKKAVCTGYAECCNKLACSDCNMSLGCGFEPGSWDCRNCDGFRCRDHQDCGCSSPPCKAGDCKWDCPNQQW